MRHLNRILVPSDFSESAEQARTWAGAVLVGAPGDGNLPERTFLSG